MQSIPIYDTVEGLTVFRDDDVPSHFYYLPRQMRIKKDKAGKPMFTFLKYTLPLERQTEEEKGGGYLVFTTELIEDQKFLTDKVVPKLGDRLRAEFPNEPNLPQPKLTAMDFTTGTVQLLLMKDDRFVDTVQAGKPSLFGDNTASYAVELKTLGADLFYQALKKGAGVMVCEYDLMFDVRLPAIHVHAHADSDEIHEATIGYTIEHIHEDSTWGDTDTDVRHRSSISESMESMGLIELTIDTGTSDLKQEDVEALRAFAFSKLDDWVKEHFLKGGSIVTDDDKASQWMEYIKEDIHQTFNLDLVQRSVIQRAYNPSAQMTADFIGGKIDDVVLEIDLGTAAWYFNNLDVAVDTNLDFEKYKDIVHSVVGNFSYEGTAKDGAKVVKRESFAFTGASNDPQHFKTRLAAVGADTYTVETVVNYKSGPVASAVLGTQKTNVRNCTLAVPNPGVMEIDLTVQDKAAFDSLKLSSIEVEIGYGDASNNVPDAVDTVVLSKDKDTVAYQRVIYAPWTKPYRYRRTYVVNDDGNTQRITTPWEDVEHDADHAHSLSVGTPFDSLFNLTVLPSVDWTDVNAVLVDLQYEDLVDDYRQKTTASFSQDSGATPFTWKFPLRDPDKRGFKFSQKLLMRNQAAPPSTWVDVPTDADTLIVGNALGGVVTVTVDPSDTGLGAGLKRVMVQLRYDDDARKVHDHATLVFKDGTPQTWSVAKSDPAVDGYTYDVQYIRDDGTPASVTGLAGTFGGSEAFIFLPAAPPVAAPAPADPTV